MTVLDQNSEPISLRVDELGRLKVIGTGGGGGGGVSDHGDLTGLNDDDHPQYLNTARGDARYPLASTLGSAAIRDVAASGDASALQVVKGNDSRLADAREWTAATVDQAEAEAGTATTRRAWTAERVRQAIAAWWAGLTVGPSKITMATAKLLGRSTAGSGAAEEIAIGSGLTLSAGTLSASGGGGLPTGVSSPGDGALDFATGSIAASRPSVNVTQTWNNAAVPFAARKVSVTDTASAASSWLDYLEIGGVGKFGVRKDGILLQPQMSAYNVPTTQTLDGYLTGAGATANTRYNIVSNGVGVASFQFSLGMMLKSTLGVQWGNSEINGAADTGLNRNAAGVVEINNGTAATYRDLKLRNLIATEGTQLTALTVGTLPAAASNTWKSCAVSDANAPTVGATVASGGSAKAVVRSNGTNWIVTEVI